MKHIRSAWALALASCVPSAALAQPGHTEAPKPTPTPPLSYRSSFSDYKSYATVPLADWRALNAAVAGAPGGMAGHAGHDMGGAMTQMPSEPKPAAAPASAPMKKGAPMQGGHHGHHPMGGKP